MILGHRRSRVTLLLVALCSLAPTPLTHATGWFGDEGSWSITYSSIFTWYDEVELHNGSEGKPGDVQFLSNSLTIEHVPRRGVSISATIPFEHSSRDGVSQTMPSFEARKPETGFSDGSLSVRLRLLDEFSDDPLSASVEFGIKTPLSNYDANKLHSFGDGQTDLEIRAGGGRIFPLLGLDHFASAEIGYRWRLGDPANEIVGFAQLGTFIDDTKSARIFVDYVDSLDGLGLESPEFGAIALAEGKPPFPRVEEDFVKLGFGFDYQVGEDTGLSIFFAKTVAAENTSWDTAIGFTIALSF